MSAGGTDYQNLLARLTRLESNAPAVLRTGAVVPSTYTPLLSAGITDGQLDLSTAAGIVFQGSMAPNVIDGQFSVGASSTTTAQIYWDGTNGSRVILIRRADGTVSVIPGSNINVSGLTANTKYTYMAYWAPGNQCGIGFSQGDTGTPEIAFSPSASATLLNQGAVQLTLAGREKLGVFSFTQPSSGSSSPGNPSSPPPINPGMCVMLGTHIKPLGYEEYDTVNAPQTDWVRIETEAGPFTRSLNCTPNHPLYDSEQGKVDASFFVGKRRWILTDHGEELITNTTQFLRSCTKVHVKMKQGHIFFANGFMSHNFKDQPDQG